MPLVHECISGILVSSPGRDGRNLNRHCFDVGIKKDHVGKCTAEVFECRSGLIGCDGPFQHNYVKTKVVEKNIAPEDEGAQHAGDLANTNHVRWHIIPVF